MGIACRMGYEAAEGDRSQKLARVHRRFSSRRTTCIQWKPSASEVYAAKAKPTGAAHFGRSKKCLKANQCPKPCCCHSECIPRPMVELPEQKQSGSTHCTCYHAGANRTTVCTARCQSSRTGKQN